MDMGLMDGIWADAARAMLKWLPYRAELDGVRLGASEGRPASIERDTTARYPTWIVRDDRVQVRLTADPRKFEVDISNLTDAALSLNWDDAVFISPAGTGMRLTHRGVTVREVLTSQAPALVPRRGSYSDVLIPVSDEETKSDIDFERLLFPADVVDEGDVQEAHLVLPLSSGGSSVDYSFDFKAIPKGEARAAEE
ncbi:MAG: hypothetical protein ABIK85_10465 [Candidatus Eisenbacteria bacterium]